MIKVLFIVMAILEGIAGAALIASPLIVTSLLLGSSLDSPLATTISRLAGLALLSLGLACWLASRGERPGASGLMAAMLLYNAGTVALLAYAGIGLGLSGIGLWPTIVVHTAVTVACIGGMKALARSNASVAK